MHENSPHDVKGKWMTGYCHERYAASFDEFGKALCLPGAGAWVLRRPIQGTPCHDGMACYPLLCCRDWKALAGDLAALEGRLVSFGAVVDPFAEIDRAGLLECFPDRLIPFKDHFVVDLSQDIHRRLTASHWRNTRKALRRVRVELCPNPIEHLDEWVRLYKALIERRRITGLRTFSRRCFELQLRTPGMVVLRARDLDREETVGMLLWYARGEVGYYHLGAFDALGYEFAASYALFLAAIEYFAGGGLKWLDLGGGSGLRQEDDGLSRFKKGWATGMRMAYFGGRILDRTTYKCLSQHGPGTDYFPAYRTGEF